MYVMLSNSRVHSNNVILKNEFDIEESLSCNTRAKRKGRHLVQNALVIGTECRQRSICRTINCVRVVLWTAKRTKKHYFMKNYVIFQKSRKVPSLRDMVAACFFVSVFYDINIFRHQFSLQFKTLKNLYQFKT